MERALLREMEELERTIGELTRRKARKARAITSPEWQIPAVRVSRRPDGFSGRQEDPASGPSAGGDPWTCRPAERQSLQALTAALQRRFTQHRSAEASREKLLSRYRCEEESWGKVAADVQRYAREAYPEFDAAAQEKLALHAFLRARAPERLRDHVSLAQPGFHKRGLEHDNSGGRHPSYPAHSTTNPPARQGGRPARRSAGQRTPLQRPARRQGRCYRCDEPGHIAHDCPAPAPKPRKPPPSGKQGKGRRSEENAAPGTNPPQPRPAEPWWTRGLPSPLSRPGVLHNTSGPKLPGAWTPTATPLTSVTGAKMAMRGKKEVKVTVTGQEVSHEFWLADIADLCIIGLDLLKRWGACVDVSRGSITWHGNSSPTVRPDTKTGPTSTPPSHHSPASKQATPASHCTQATVTDHSAPARPLARPPPPALPRSNRLPSPNQLCLPRRQQLSTPCGNEAAAGSTTSSASSSKASWMETQTFSQCGMRTVPRPSWCSTPSTPTQLNPSRLRPHRMFPCQATGGRGKGEIAAKPKEVPAPRRETAFLGHIVSERGVATDPSKGGCCEGLAGPWQRGRSNPWPLTSSGRPSLKLQCWRTPTPSDPSLLTPTQATTGVGAVLSQEDEDGERVVAYYSRALGKAERNYCVTRRELLAVVRALHHFRPYLQGSHFLLRTDHASLTWLLTFKDPEGQVARWLEQLQGYDFEIRHRAGRLHGNADALSRRPCAAQECCYCSRQEERDQVSPDVAVVQANGDAEGWLPLTPMELREAQEADSTLGKVRSWLEAGQRPERSVVSQRAQRSKATTAVQQPGAARRSPLQTVAGPRPGQRHPAAVGATGAPS
ncbi:hypothetical protein SKAU_G00138510 [Synaphobranchus kaupii]|uniref:CCHC-type domain-containing protein n=1 Tax=Synaphobranchus kaupii TaxID=118154 RepID=A0A9Q1FRS6_SYNKA|nr:hypothetical protein SKAU_G00138510 [Synaphobranchus kaupii]